MLMMVVMVMVVVTMTSSTSNSSRGSYTNGCGGSSGGDSHCMMVVMHTSLSWSLCLPWPCESKNTLPLRAIIK